MAKLRSLTVERYRNFRHRARFSIAPLTLLIGKNGSGKSVLSRLPMLLSDSLHNGERDQPIRLETWGVRHAIEYLDIPYMKTSMPFIIGVEVQDGDDVREFLAQIRYVKEKDRLILEEYSILEKGVKSLHASISDDDQLLQQRPTYKCDYKGVDRTEELNGFYGLMPEFTGALKEEMKLVLEGFKSALPPVSYLGPFRTEVGHFIGSPRPDLDRIGVKGENAIEIICDDKLRSSGALLRSVSDWFESAMEHRVSVVKNGDYSRISLNPVGKELSISLSETGAGFSQVLPIAVQNFVARSNDVISSTLIIEQPELHLHPAVHGEIADLYLSTAKKTNGATIMETHSEEIIMRLRRRIAEGLSPEFVRILSVGHSRSADAPNGDVKEITFDEEGNPSDWPDGVFEESFRELAEIRAATRG
ncbi:AAA family ATPase [Paracoccus pacificus]|uniref:AAA family ATPase n=1 Tax=Paracoccus pacificus TaxID=1463598 RepID=A0ABW4RDK1_9RHOB